MNRTPPFAWKTGLFSILLAGSFWLATRGRQDTIQTIELPESTSKKFESNNTDNRGPMTQLDVQKKPIAPNFFEMDTSKQSAQEDRPDLKKPSDTENSETTPSKKTFTWRARSGYRPIIEFHRTNSDNKKTTSEWLGDSILVTTKEPESGQNLLNELKPLGVIAAHNLGSPMLWEVQLDAQSAEDFLDKMKNIRSSHRVLDAGPNDFISLNQQSNDPLLGLQYALGDLKTSALARTKLNPAKIEPIINANPDANVKALTSWQLKRDCRPIKIGIIDSGIDENHPDLNENLNLSLSRNFVTQQVLKQPDCKTKELLTSEPNTIEIGLLKDENGHGTHVAGTIGAITNNGIGVAGVCWKAEIIVLRTMNYCGIGTRSAILSAISYAGEIGVKVLNMSLSGELTETDKASSSPSYMTVDSFGKKGGLIVSAAGNESLDISVEANSQFPGTLDLPHVLNVGSISANNQVSLFSNYGPAYVHISAPGDMIMSTYPSYLQPTNLPLITPLGTNSSPSVNALFRQALMKTPNQGYEILSGTSMAAPHVAGAAAVVWSLDPSRSSQDIRKILLETSDEVSNHADKIDKGRRLNLMRAVKATMGYSIDVSAPVGDTKTDVSVSQGMPVLIRLLDSTEASLKNAQLFLGSSQIGTCSGVDMSCVGRISDTIGPSGDGKSQPLSIKGPTSQIAAGSIRVLALSAANGVFQEDSISRSCRLLAAGKNYATFKTPSLSVCKNMCRMLLVGTGKSDGVCEFGDQSELLQLDSCSLGGE